MRLWPDTLAGRTLALLLGLVLVLIVASAIILLDERHERFEERSRYQLIDRVATLVHLLSDADDEERDRIVDHFTRHGDHISVDSYPFVKHKSKHPIERAISRKLHRALRKHNHSVIHVKVDFEDDHESHDHPRHLRARMFDVEDITIAIKLWDQTWLNIRTDNIDPPPPWAGKSLQLLALLVLLLAISGIFIARRMAKPMAQLASSAEQFGMGHKQAPLKETGPKEIRHTIRAFNQMQERLEKHIRERANMLAAVSHDLRTPITTLRLRAEYISDDETREKTLATLAEMESILSETLGFARDEAADEKVRTTDIAALLQSLVDDHADLGGDTQYRGPDKLNFVCRPVSLKRAMNNLIENALLYGQSAHTSLQALDNTIVITIEDNGPGIPEDQLEDVFTPFYRLESSRNRETGGTGLGLAVVRTVVLAHGGDIQLSNIEQGGLKATIKLPIAST